MLYICNNSGTCNPDDEFFFMRALKQPFVFPVTTLAFVCMLSACDKDPEVNSGTQEFVQPDVTTVQIPATPQTAKQPVPQPEARPPAEETRSSDTLILSIEETPFEETSNTGFGTKSSVDWLNENGNGAPPSNPPADDNLLPDLFAREDRDKAASVKMDVLIDDDQPDMTNAIDGAGLSIEYKTDR
jgi:hypothetical protein